MRVDDLWCRVQDHLDARRDPLDDEEVRACLEAHPECFDAFADLIAGLRVLDATPPVKAQRRIPRPVAAAAAAAALLIVVGAISVASWLNRDTDPVIVLPDVSTEGRVLTYSAQCFTQESGQSIEHWTERGEVTVRDHQRNSDVQPGVTTLSGHAILTELSSVTLRIRPELLSDRP